MGRCRNKTSALSALFECIVGILIKIDLSVVRCKVRHWHCQNHFLSNYKPRTNRDDINNHLLGNYCTSSLSVIFH